MAKKLSGAKKDSLKKSHRQHSTTDQLIELVGLIVAESGNPDKFNARMWVKEWLTSSNPALGNLKPATFMKTKAGRETIFSLISQIQSGAYA